MKRSRHAAGQYTSGTGKHFDSEDNQYFTGVTRSGNRMQMTLSEPVQALHEPAVSIWPPCGSFRGVKATYHEHHTCIQL